MFLSETNHPSIIELIDEVFDSASTFMTDNAMMFGSTVASILAGLPAQGDLDIAVSSMEYQKLTERLASSTKWVQIEGSHVPEKHGSKRTRGFSIDMGNVGLAALATNPYDRPSRPLPITKIVAFRNVQGRKIQVIQAKAATGDPLQDALSVVRQVDITCCSVAVDRYGRMLETAKHGLADCKARIIRMNYDWHRFDKARLIERIRKYTRRGWLLSMSLDKAIENSKSAAPSKEKQATLSRPAPEPN